MSRVRDTLEGNHTPATFPEPATAAPSVEVDVGYDDMNKADLKALAALRDLSVTSRMTKPEIIMVLEEADNDAEV